MELLDYERKHLDFVKENAAEGTLFLKKNNDFPLVGPCPIAAYGSGVRHTVKGGTGSGEVNSRFSVNIEQGLKDAGFSITTDKWLEAYENVIVENNKKFVNDMKAEAKANHQNVMIYAMGKVVGEPDHNLPVDGQGDVAIYVLSRSCGEGNDRTATRGDILLTETERRTILECNKKYEKFLLVLNVGGPIDLSEVDEVENILLLSQLGVVTGTVLADIILGKANPTGKLTTTWSKWEDYASIGTFGDKNDNRYKEGIYVGYRYFDTLGKKAMYPFGFGLSFTTFSIDDVTAVSEGQQISLSAKVTNTGSFAGKEVIQVYVSAPEGKLDKAYQDLTGFAKTKELQPGQSQTVNISFKLSDIASYDEQTASYILDAGNYVIRVGNSSVNTMVAAVAVLDETVTVLKCRNCLGEADFTDYKPENKKAVDIPADVAVLKINASDIALAEVKYDQEYEVDDLIKKLTDEELCYMQVGAFDPKGGVASIIGEASTHVAGAAGETTSVCEKYGIKPIIMADGPAGVRVSKDYYEDEKGAHATTVTMPLSLEMFMTGLLKVAYKLFATPKIPKDAVIKHQYATAIPIGTSIAQSFNYDLAKAYGDIVGAEMEMFGVHLWLAPALNIHRSILCGRNFEYYSEDPLVSGVFAAAITEGVQQHPDCGTTIKHYAANNAEYNRYTNNSIVSERAMREIYLKGFRIAVQMSQPHALMTSYNLLNGTHTSEHRGLIEDVLRCEFGYKGIVMTDWVIAAAADKSAAHRGADAGHVAMAGGDVFMPGCKKDFESVAKALKDGSISRKQLEINASRIYAMSQKLTDSKLEK